VSLGALTNVLGAATTDEAFKDGGLDSTGINYQEQEALPTDVFISPHSEFSQSTISNGAVAGENLLPDSNEMQPPGPEMEQTLSFAVAGHFASRASERTVGEHPLHTSDPDDIIDTPASLIINPEGLQLIQRASSVSSALTSLADEDDEDVASKPESYPAHELSELLLRIHKEYPSLSCRHDDLVIRKALHIINGHPGADWSGSSRKRRKLNNSEALKLQEIAGTEDLLVLLLGIHAHLVCSPKRICEGTTSGGNRCKEFRKSAMKWLLADCGDEDFKDKIMIHASARRYMTA